MLWGRSTFQLCTSVHVPMCRRDVFHLFGDAFRLEELTPSWLRFEVLTPSPVAMREGVQIDYRLRLHGLPVRWRTRITAWEPPVRFQDSQIRGPYLHWIHTHTFEERNGGTLVRDEVNYALPGGRLIHRLFVRRDLKRIFAYRQQQLPRLLGLEPAECDIGPVTITRQ